MNRRRHRTSTATMVALLLLGLAPQHAAADGPRHGLSAFGDLAYPADFKHFRWVNPDAPKGGRLAMIGTAALNTFDSFNPFILKGDPAQGLGHLLDSLMTSGLDEPDAVPQWYKPVHHVAYWDKYGRPALKRRFDRIIIHSWWYDPAKAAKLENN
jgi:ABC-type oligopeptide transport system substrate-binding subunit